MVYGQSANGGNYCKQCGLQFRLWNVKVETPVCEECEPEKWQKQYKTNITMIKKRTMAQEHITEHTFFPKETTWKTQKWWRNNEKYRRNQK